MKNVIVPTMLPAPKYCQNPLKQGLTGTDTNSGGFPGTTT